MTSSCGRWPARNDLDREGHGIDLAPAVVTRPLAERRGGRAARGTGSTSRTLNWARGGHAAPARAARRRTRPPRSPALDPRDPLPAGLNDAHQPVAVVDRRDRVLVGAVHAVHHQDLGVRLEPLEVSFSAPAGPRRPGSSSLSVAPAGLGYIAMTPSGPLEEEREADRHPEARPPLVGQRKPVSPPDPGPRGRNSASPDRSSSTPRTRTRACAPRAGACAGGPRESPGRTGRTWPPVSGGPRASRAPIAGAVAPRPPPPWAGSLLGIIGSLPPADAPFAAPARAAAGTGASCRRSSSQRPPGARQVEHRPRALPPRQQHAFDEDRRRTGTSRRPRRSR